MAFSGRHILLLSRIRGFDGWAFTSVDMFGFQFLSVGPIGMGVTLCVCPWLTYTSCTINFTFGAALHGMGMPSCTMMLSSYVYRAEAND